MNKYIIIFLLLITWWDRHIIIFVVICILLNYLEKSFIIYIIYLCFLFICVVLKTISQLFCHLYFNFIKKSYIFIILHTFPCICFNKTLHTYKFHIFPTIFFLYGKTQIFDIFIYFITFRKMVCKCVFIVLLDKLYYFWYKLLCVLCFYKII